MRCNAISFRNSAAIFAFGALLYLEQHTSYARQHWRKSQTLQKALLDFEERQTACVEKTTGDERFVLVKKEEADGGIGNQLPTHITGLLLALITERCLFSASGLFLRMFANTAAYDWHQHYLRLLEVGKPRPSLYEVDINSASALTDWLLKNQTGFLWPFQAIILEGDFDYSAPFLLANPLYRNFSSRAFPRGEAFWALSSYLLKPLQSLNQAMNHFKARNFRQLNIGLQIRRKKCMLACLHPPCTYEAASGSTGCDFLPEVKDYVAMAKALQIVRDVTDEETAFFVATDEASVYDEVIALLGNDSVIFRRDSGIGKIVNSAGNPGSIRSGLIDMMLLSECDEIVMTGSSTFGSVAAGWGGVAPVVMLPGPHLDIDNPYWYKALNSEPCISKGYSLMGDGHLSGVLNESAIQVFKSSPFWMQSLQCHSSMKHYF